MNCEAVRAELRVRSRALDRARDRDENVSLCRFLGRPCVKRIGRLLLAVSAVAAGAVFLRYQNEVGRARDAARRGSALIDTEAGPIEYAEAGAGVPLLSIHGAGGGFDQGLSLAAEFVSDGFRIIAPSRFGYLRTPVPPDDFPAAQADAHAALLSKLNVPKAIVVGVSAGARSAIELAIRRPDMVAALVLVVPGAYSPTSPVSVDSSSRQQIRSLGCQSRRRFRLVGHREDRAVDLGPFHGSPAGTGRCCGSARA